MARPSSEQQSVVHTINCKLNDARLCRYYGEVKLAEQLEVEAIELYEDLRALKEGRRRPSLRPLWHYGAAAGAAMAVLLVGTWFVLSVNHAGCIARVFDKQEVCDYYGD